MTCKYDYLEKEVDDFFFSCDNCKSIFTTYSLFLPRKQDMTTVKWAMNFIFEMIVNQYL